MSSFRIWRFLNTTGMQAGVLVALIAVSGIGACHTKRYDMSTVEGQIACSLAEARVQEKCVRDFLRNGGRIHGVSSDPTFFYNASGFMFMDPGTPFFPSGLHLTSLLVTTSGADTRYIAGYCRDRVVPNWHQGDAKRMEACQCAKICNEPQLYSKFNCGSWHTDLPSLTRRQYNLDNSFPSCSFEDDERNDWKEWKNSIPSVGDPPMHGRPETMVE